MKTIFLVLLVLISVMSAYGGLAGGISDDEKPVSSELKGYVQSIETEIKSSAMASLASSSGGDSNSEAANMFQNSTVDPLAYKSQVVAGINYFVKVRVANMYFHARIYRDLKGNVTLSKVIGPKEASDPIEYF